MVLLILSVPQHAFAAGGLLDPSRLKDMPRWPIFIIVFVSFCALCYSAVSQYKNRRSKSKVFPKLALRRRLYAPYSGGNCAKTTFAPRHHA